MLPEDLPYQIRSLRDYSFNSDEFLLTITIISIDLSLDFIVAILQSIVPPSLSLSIIRNVIDSKDGRIFREFIEFSQICLTTL